MKEESINSGSWDTSMEDKMVITMNPIVFENDEEEMRRNPEYIHLEALAVEILGGMI